MLLPNGHKHGAERAETFEGHCKWVQYFADNQAHGKHIWWDYLFQLRVISHWETGRQHGVEETYDGEYVCNHEDHDPQVCPDGGNLISRRHWIRGEKHGIEFRWTRNKIIETEWEHDHKVCKLTYDRHGRLIKTRQYPERHDWH